jgi:protein gp37
VTAENQEMADKRLPVLLQTPAAKRFVSVEPMLSAVNLHLCHYCIDKKEKCLDHCELDWVIVGAESGVGRRMCSNDWTSAVVDQCKNAGVPCFVKQLHANGTTDLIKEPTGWPRQFPC